MTLTEREKRIEAFIEYNRKICWEAEYQNGEYCIGENKVRKFLNNIDIATAEHDKARNQALDEAIGEVWKLADTQEKFKIACHKVTQILESLKTKP